MHGEGGALSFGTIQIGTLGRWQLRGGEGERATFTASGCTIASFWLSAGLTRLCARPHANGKPKLWSVAGDVQVIEEHTITLINISIKEEGAAS